MMNQEISCSEENLNKLHELYSWIPCREQTRPNIDELNVKERMNKQNSKVYYSKEDEILIQYFGYDSKLIVIDMQYKLQSSISLNEERKFICIPNEFPYQIPKNTFHYILWYSYLDVDKSKINEHIFQCLKEINKEKKFEFVWYENPSMSVPEVYHVQIFWHFIE